MIAAMDTLAHIIICVTIILSGEQNEKLFFKRSH